MNSNDNITITFHVNGKLVEQELKKLEQQATELRTKMDAAFTAGDTKQHKKLEQQLKQVEKQTERVAGQHRRLNQTLNNLSTAKPKELRAAMKRLNEELGNPAVKRGSKKLMTYSFDIDKKSPYIANELAITEGNNRKPPPSCCFPHCPTPLT